MKNVLRYILQLKYKSRVVFTDFHTTTISNEETFTLVNLKRKLQNYPKIMSNFRIFKNVSSHDDFEVLRDTTTIYYASRVFLNFLKRTLQKI